MYKTFIQESNIGKIFTKYGVYKYKKIDLFYGRKIIDMNVEENNLLDVKRIFDSLNIPFGLMYGTLLGAVRENNFIEYDTDVDIYVLDEFRESVLSSLFNLRKLSFEVVRYRGDLLSIIRDDDYIDIYFFKKTFWGKRSCNNDTVKAQFLEQNETIKFLNKTFKVPYNYFKLLEILYDKDWKIPKYNSPGSSLSNFTKFKITLKRVLPKRIVFFLKIIEGKITKKEE